MDQPQRDEHDSDEEAIDRAPLTYESVPRLRIMHLMLWTLFTAVFMTASQAIRTLQREPENFSNFMDVSGVFYGMMVGAVMTGMAVLISNRFNKGAPLCLQPGHWLVVIQAFAYTLIIPVWGLSTAWAAYGGTFVFLPYGLINLGEACGYGLAAKNSSIKRWKVFFTLLTLLMVGQGLTYLGLPFGWLSHGLWSLSISTMLLVGIILCSVLLFVVWRDKRVWQDKREHLGRDWVHWTGIYCFWASYLINFAWTLSVSFM